VIELWGFMKILIKIVRIWTCIFGYRELGINFWRSLDYGYRVIGKKLCLGICSIGCIMGICLNRFYYCGYLFNWFYCSLKSIQLKTNGAI
jgi:hypothetical protein